MSREDLEAEKVADSSPELEEIVEEQPIVPNSDAFQVVITCKDIPELNICLNPEPPAALVEVEDIPEVDLTSLPRIRSPVKTVEQKQENLISILKKVSDNLQKSPRPKKSVNFLLPSPQARKSPRFAEQLKHLKEISNSFLLHQKFFIVIESFFSDYAKRLRIPKTRNGGKPLLIRTFHWVKTIEIYSRLVQQAVMMSKKRQNDASGSQSESTTKTKKSTASSEEYSKKLHRKLSENRQLIMQPNRNKCTVEKDCSYAYNYLDRVKKTLSEHGDDELYMEFMSTLSSFDADNESVPELYNVRKTFLIYTFP